MSGLRWGLGLGAVALGGAAVLTPAAVRAVAGRGGVEVEAARWCGRGMCLEGVTGAGARVARVTVGWDRVVRAEGVEVELAALRAAVAGDAAPGGGGPRLGGLAAAVRRVEVEGLTVAGTPLPPLAGEVWPARRLEGDGVRVEGDEVTARVPTAWGPVEVVARPAEGGLDLTARAEAVVVRSERLGPAPVPLPTVRFEGRWDGERAVGRLAVGGVDAAVEARGGPDAGEAVVTLDGVAVADVYALLDAVVPEAGRARIEGELDATLRATWPGGELEVVPRLAGLRVDGVLPPGFDGGPFRYLARGAEGAARLRASGEGTEGWLPLAEAGEWLPAAIIAAEDARFRAHPGYDLEGMLAAAADNEARGEVWRGGSTLTQQLAKNLFLDPSRTYARKLRELLYAVEMEEDLGKARILELYLNVVEWGPGLWGARAAADAYFLKQPRGLLPEEAAWLASILPRPRSAWAEEYLADRPSRRRVDSILANMPGLDEAARAAARARPIRFVPPVKGGLSLPTTGTDQR